MSTFRDMTSQKFSFHNWTNHCDSIFSPWNRAKLEENYYLCLKKSFLAQIHTALCISTVLKQYKKLIRSKFWDILFQKQLQQLLLVNRSCQNSARMCLIDRNKKSLNLEVVDRTVLELWSIIWWSGPKSSPPPPPPKVIGLKHCESE